MVGISGKLKFMSFTMVFKPGWNFTGILWSHILSLWIEGEHRVRYVDLDGAAVCSRQAVGVSMDSGCKPIPGVASELL